MDSSTNKRRLTRLEVERQRRPGVEVVYSIPITLVDMDSGRVIVRRPAERLTPGARIDYRLGIVEVENGDK